MKGDRYCCKHHKMDRFLEVCLLLLLSDEKGYGYGLIERLENFGFQKEETNVGSLYATLRKMEARGLVASDWEKGESGPRRRVYEITPEGGIELGQWVEILKFRKMRIEKLIGEYEKGKSEEA